ncbi:putative ABC transport system permease protein [Ferrimonas sediminum]|uniref:Putative ABC transport system permease protein n=1 Tax=Ferrimonas sediminum TaxID=718193 RepID=A0A1G8TMD9_9GAMM|nr:ABC transporter permease [Ferrimonas sediminum]SDJ42583.1 putative ABC transport system permease protein [Ferrimonas sediminum]
MIEWRWAQITLSCHYRRHPWQLVFLLLGLVLGASLMVGVETINQEAKARYALSEQQARAGAGWQIEPRQREGYLPQSLWVSLRRQGIDANPILNAKLIDEQQRPLLIRGVDPLAFLARLEATDAPKKAQPRAWIDRQFASSRGWKPGAHILLDSGDKIGPIALIADLGPWILMDIADVASLTGSRDRVSYLTLPTLTATTRTTLSQQLPANAVLKAQGEATQFGQLSQSFHLNLTALALMALAVSLFLAFNALRFSLSQRAPLIAQLRSLGVSQRAIMTAVIIELMLVGVLAVPISAVLGSYFASAWIPQVQMTLASLYGFEDQLSVQSLWLPMQLSALVTFGAVTLVLVSLYFDPKVALSLGIRSRQLRQQQQGRWLLGLGLALLLALLVLAPRVTTTATALSLCGVLLFAGAAITPYWLQNCCRAVASVPLPGVMGRWIMADLDEQQRTTRVAMIAIMLALAAAVGMRMVVGSFELALTGYLNQRLSADLYIRPPPGQHPLWLQRLNQMPEITRITPFQHQRARIASVPGSIASLGGSGDHYGHLPLKAALPQWQAQLFQEGCLINERSELMAGLTLGQAITIDDSGHPAFECRVVGVFYDYGNLNAQSFISPTMMQRQLGDVPFAGYSLIVQPGQTDAVYQRLLHWLSPSQVIQRKNIRAIATTMFHQTFAVTTALNVLTLMVAAVGLFASLSSVEHHRLNQLATLMALGVGRSQLLLAQLAQLLLIAVFALVVALPLGVGLGYLLLQLVNRVAFGWTMPVHWLMGDWPGLLASLLLALILAALWPLWRLSNSPISKLLRGVT